MNEALRMCAAQAVGPANQLRNVSSKDCAALFKVTRPKRRFDHELVFFELCMCAFLTFAVPTIFLLLP